MADPTLFAPLPVFPSITTPRMGPPGKRLGRKEKGERRKEISRSLPMQVIAAARLLRLRFGYGVICMCVVGWKENAFSACGHIASYALARVGCTQKVAGKYFRV